MHAVIVMELVSVEADRYDCNLSRSPCAKGRDSGYSKYQIGFSRLVGREVVTVYRSQARRLSRHLEYLVFVPFCIVLALG
jgi:hypothetical protein